jgi:acyl-CoA thioester hydrolase
MIKDTLQLRPRYDEVDKMGYVYHANYLKYYHQARTELLRKYGVNDSFLEGNNIMLPVISFEIKYKKPAHYDELIFIKTTLKKFPRTRLHFEFEITTKNGTILNTAKSTVVFVNSLTRLPIRVPVLVSNALKHKFQTDLHETNCIN